MTISALGLLVAISTLAVFLAGYCNVILEASKLQSLADTLAMSTFIKDDTCSLVKAISSQANSDVQICQVSQESLYLKLARQTIWGTITRSAKVGFRNC
ncbi:MAG: hypothetical protein LBC43_00840 [Bifidobacteriaceae bacterium]|nr:hypothetical protein [Bifidobacteriaceae bacterium]